MAVADYLEMIMIICFGASWPLNIYKAYKSKTAKGTSLFFLILIATGYIAGITGKIVLWSNNGDSYWTFTRILASVFYVINLIMLITAILIYFRNKKQDKLRLLKKQEFDRQREEQKKKIEEQEKQIKKQQSLIKKQNKNK